MIVSPGSWIPQQKKGDVARGAKTLNNTERRSIRELPNQTWLIISSAPTLVHEQKNEIRVNKVIYLTLHKVLCVCVACIRQIHEPKSCNSNIQEENQQISPHNGASLLLKMLMRHLLKHPYLHYKHCFQKWGSWWKARPSVLHPSEMFSRWDCARQELQWKIAATKKTLPYIQTSPVHSASCSDAGSRHEKTAPLRSLLPWF